MLLSSYLWIKYRPFSKLSAPSSKTRCILLFEALQDRSIGLRFTPVRSCNTVVNLTKLRLHLSTNISDDVNISMNPWLKNCDVSFYSTLVVCCSLNTQRPSLNHKNYASVCYLLSSTSMLNIFTSKWSLLLANTAALM